MTEINIRKIASDEFAFAKDLIVMFGFDGETPNQIFSSNEYLQDMLGRDDFHVIVALEGDKVIGGVTSYEMKMFKRETTEMFLYEIEVAEEYRRQGIAKALIEHLINICREKGIVEMFVGTERGNLPANRLYETTGGIPDSESVWYSYKFS